MPFRNEDPSWRALLLLTATACTLTAASVFLYVANSVLHAPSRRQRPQQQQQAEAKAPEELLEEKADKPKTMANDKGMGTLCRRHFLPLRLCLTLVAYAVTYLNNADACYDFVVGKNDSDEFEDAKHVASVICTGWYVAAICNRTVCIMLTSFMNRENAKADDISVKIVCGGITNRLYRLTWEDKVNAQERPISISNPSATHPFSLSRDAQSVLVRLYGDNTEAFIDRAVENST